MSMFCRRDIEIIQL